MPPACQPGGEFAEIKIEKDATDQLQQKKQDLARPEQQPAARFVMFQPLGHLPAKGFGEK